MAIHYIVGNPGSGKSYYGVYILYDKFIRTKKTNFFSRFTKQKEQKQYDFGYTNINEFNFDSSDKIRKLELEPLKEKLSLLYNMYKLNAPDSELIETAKSFDLFNVIFVIDEIHNFFVSKDEILIWWLTYHRHLHHELYLITQDLSLVDNEYKRIAEFFYRAVDSSKRFFSKKFRYFQYTSYRLYEKDLVRRFHIDFIQEVFNLYHSGDDNIRSSYLRKFLYISFFLLIFSFFLFYMLKSLVTPSDDTSKPSQKFTDSNRTKVSANIRQNLPSDKIDDTLGFYYKYTCVGFDCKFDNSDDLFDLRLLSYLLSKTEILYKIDSNKSKNSVEINIIIKDDVFKVLNITFNTNKNSKGLTDDFKNPSFASDSSIFLPTLSGRNN